MLAETAFHLGSVAIVLQMIETGLVQPVFHCADHLPHLVVLAERFRDRAPDLADLCLIRLSELHPHHTVLTTDRADFAVYRRNKCESIPLCTPLN